MKTLKFTKNNFLYYGTILMAVFFLSFQFTISDITPRFDDCNDLFYDLTQMNCNNWQTLNEVMEIYPGCFVEVDYLLKKCTLASGVEHLKMELVGFRVINYPGCTALISNLFLPNGQLNEAYARIYMQQIYMAVSDKWMQNKINAENLTSNPLWRCTNEFKPFHGGHYFEAKEGTCMALCRTTQVIQYNNPPFVIGPIGVSYTTEYISNVKCTNSCCWIHIYYCYDPSQNSWVRNYNIAPWGSNLDCPVPPVAIEPCYSPPIFVGSGNVIITSSNSELYPCTQTCDDLNSPEYLNW